MSRPSPEEDEMTHSEMPSCEPDDDPALPAGDPALRQLTEELYSGTERRQREIARQLGTTLKTCSEWSPATRNTHHVLVHRYLTLASKSAIKPFILNYLDSVDTRVYPLAESALTSSLEVRVTSRVTSERRELSDSVCRLLDCRRAGGAVARLAEPVMAYLVWCLQSAHHDSLAAQDSVVFNQAMTDIKVAVHTLNKFLQKMDSFVLSAEAGADLVSLCVRVIRQENALLDCQTSCAMTLTLAYHRLHGPLAAATLTRDLFVSPRPEFSTADLQTHLCLLTGVLGGLTPTELCSPGPGAQEAPQEGPAPTVLQLVTDKVLQACDCIEEASPSKYSLSRCLIVFTAKLTACAAVSAPPNFPALYKRLLQYIYNHIEDPVDGVRFQAKNVFENVIKMQQSVCEETESLVDLARDLISMDWHRKGKYGLLSILLGHLDAAAFLDLCPDMPWRMLACLDDVGMSNYVSDLYDKLMVKHVGCVSAHVWQTTWLDPVVRALARPELRHAVTTFVLPKVLQADRSGLAYIVPSLVSADLQHDSLLVLVTCLRRARCLGYLPQTDNVNEWNDVIPRGLLCRALEHADPGLRSEAFALLCYNPKTTEIIPKADFDLVLDFLVNNLTSQSPAFRQDILSAFRKLMMRVQESWNLFVKKRSEDQVQYYAAFVHDLYEHLAQNVYAGVSFTRRSCALGLLTACERATRDVRTLPGLDAVVQAEHAENLLHMLADTFEENKALALGLLVRLDARQLGLDRPDTVRELVAVSDDLLVTTRPQDCTTAAYLHKLVLQQPALLSVLQQLPGVGAEGSASTGTGEASGTTAEDGMETRQRLLLQRLTAELDRQVGIGQSDLIHASLHAPMYPVIHCARHLLSDVAVPRTRPGAWRPLLATLINLAFRACAVVAPVISHASPEGNVPVSDLIGGEGDDASLGVVQEMPEFLVVCSWRTVKEASLLLGDLSTWPIHSQAQDGYMDVDTLLEIGKFYTDLLLESRHRGAFELAYAGFQPMCGMLWNSRLDSTNQLPSTWLAQILADIGRSDQSGSRLCATRRSAGVPFYVLALVVTEPANRGRKCLGTAMQALLTMAAGDRDLCRIHALNCLRALYKDNRLGECVLAYVSEGVRIAVLGFSAESWAVRNASTLLFSALMVRVFGVRRDRNVLCSKNSLSGRVFFYRYPKLFPFLLEQLRTCTESIGTLHPGLYPVLLVLGRLTPSVLEGSDTAMNVADFIPHVMRCAASPVLKTRQMGARALCPIVCKDQLGVILAQICGALESSQTQNLTHGLLLQLGVLLEDARARRLAVRDDVLRRIYRSSWLMGRRNACYMTRCEYVHVLGHVMALVTDERFLRRLHEDALVVIHQEVAALSPERNQCHTLFMSALAELYVSRADTFDECRLVRFLTGHRLYEVRQVALTYLRQAGRALPGLHARLHREQHPACLALLLEILAGDVGAPTDPHVRHMAPTHHDVVCARLRYLSASTDDEDRECVVSDVVSLCRDDRDVVTACRLACADVVFQLRGLLTHRNALQPQLWAVSFTLLLDDDDDVRSRMGDVMSRLCGSEGGDVSLSDGVALGRCVDLVLRSLSASDCLTFVTDVLRGADRAPPAGADRLFDKGESSTYEDRLHVALLLVSKVTEHVRAARFTFCEKLVTTLFRSVSADLQQAAHGEAASRRARLLASARYVDHFSHDFSLFCALYLLDKVRASLRMPEFEPSFASIKSKYFSCFSHLMWPLSKFT